MFSDFDSTGWMPTARLVADWLIRLGLSLRIIMRGRPVGFTLAWLSVVLILPLAGAMAYLMFGELRLGRRRAEWAEQIHGPYREWLRQLNNRSQVDWQRLGSECRSLAHLCRRVGGNPGFAGQRAAAVARRRIRVSRAGGRYRRCEAHRTPGILYFSRGRHGRRNLRGTAVRRFAAA